MNAPKPRSLGRNILAVIAGAIVCGLVIAVVELPTYVIHPPKEGMDLSDSAQLQEHAENAPAAAKLIVVLAWGAGSFCGGWVAGRLSRGLLPAMIIAGLFELAAIYNLATIPSPWWMWAGGLLIFFPAAYAGALLAMRKGAATSP